MEPMLQSQAAHVLSKGEERREERRVRGGDKEQRNKEDKGKKR